MELYLANFVRCVFADGHCEPQTERMPTPQFQSALKNTSAQQSLVAFVARSDGRTLVSAGKGIMSPIVLNIWEPPRVRRLEEATSFVLSFRC